MTNKFGMGQIKIIFIPIQQQNWTKIRQIIWKIVKNFDGIMRNFDIEEANYDLPTPKIIILISASLTLLDVVFN